jgi:vacuolar-type H+-ATPase subunit D/Vma8
MGQLLKFSLEDHLAECEERFNALLDKLDQTDRRLDRIEDLILEIKASLKNQ